MPSSDPTCSKAPGMLSMLRVLVYERPHSSTMPPLPAFAALARAAPPWPLPRKQELTAPFPKGVKQTEEKPATWIISRSASSCLPCAV